MKGLLCAVGMWLALQAAQAADLYRWVDKSGNVHYGDTAEEDAEKLKISAPPGDASGLDDASLPYEARLARKNFPVTLYTSENCGDYCNQARDFLRKRKVPFSETVLKTQDDLDAFKQKSGIDSVPVLSVGRTWLSGFQPGGWAGELDVAGYPK